MKFLDTKVTKTIARRSTRRNGRKGFTLLLTIGALVVIGGLTSLMVVQSLSQQRSLGRLAAIERDRVSAASNYVLVAPYVRQSMVKFDEEPLVDLNGSPQNLSIMGHEIQMYFQDVEGVFDVDLGSIELAEDLFGSLVEVSRFDLVPSGSTLEQRLARAGFSIEEIKLLSSITTDRARSRRLNEQTMPRMLKEFDSPSISKGVFQPSLVHLRIEN